jgi:hypothetical protein
MASTIDELTNKFLAAIKYFCLRNRLILFFFIAHVFFATFLGRMYAFAPDEKSYLDTFNRMYTLDLDTSAQSGSGWSTAPTIFLWIAYLPAKILNLVGIPDYLSIRLLSIMLTTLSLFLFLKMNYIIGKAIRTKLIYFSFFIPSVFLWTSTGLREAFVIFQITLFLVGLNYLFMKKNKKGISMLFVGSYGLLSTKPYLWVLLMLAVILFSLINLILRTHREFVIKLIAPGFIAPLILFLGTSSQEVFNYYSESSITEVGQRPGTSSIEFLPETEILPTFQAGTTLIYLHFYLIENPDSVFTKVFKVFNLDDKVESLWNERLQTGLISESKPVEKDTSSLSGHILKPGVITEPWTMLWPAFVFLAGPFPLIGEVGIVATIASFESPLWWSLYALVIFQFYRFRKSKLFRDPAILFTLIFLAGEIAFSSLVEVNLGTSFRHRSILLVPLIFLYLRIAQRAHELRDPESKPIL